MKKTTLAAFFFLLSMLFAWFTVDASVAVAENTPAIQPSTYEAADAPYRNDY